MMPQAGRVGDNAKNPSDTHGCPVCAHSVEGPATQGSPDVFVNGRSILRVGDPGEHGSCCGSNTWQAMEGSSGVFVNGKRLHRVGDTTEHCGGDGALVQGSPNLFIGDMGPGSAKSVPHDRSVTLEVKDALGRSIKNAIARATCPHKNYEDVPFSGETTISGLCSGASVAVVKGLQKGEWDKGASSGYLISPSYAVAEGGETTVHAPASASTPPGKGTNEIAIPRANG